MRRTIMGTFFAVALLAAFAMVGCAATDSTTTTPPPAPDGPPTLTMLAPGLYDLSDGTVEAVGTLEWADLEKGFWTISGGTKATGDVGKTVAVIVNAAKDDPQYVTLAGAAVRVLGSRTTGGSASMAGLEIEATSISEADDNPSPSS